MYLPSSFRLENPEPIARLLRDHAFGLLVTHGALGLEASHLPFEFDADSQTLVSHLARANEQWQSFDGREALAVFSGPHAYVSPSWYETELAVPTWNYLAVHVSGVPRVIEDDARVAELLDRLVARHEAPRAPSRKLTAPAEWQETMRRAIVAFEMRATKIEAKAKLSQNRPWEDRERVIEAFEGEGQTELAAWMRRLSLQP